MSLTSFKNILSIISSLAMEGSIFMGELPGFLLEVESENVVGHLSLLFPPLNPTRAEHWLVLFSVQKESCCKSFL